MRLSISFLIDECLPVDVAHAFSEVGYEVLYPDSSSRRGMSDDEVWQLAASEHRVLVTRDLDFPLLYQPRPLGLIIVRVPSWYRRSQIEVVREFIAASDLSQTVGHITVIRPSQLARYRPLDTIS